VAETSAERLALCRALDCADVEQINTASAAGRHPAEAPLAQALAQRFAGLSLAESLAHVQKAGIPCAPAVEGHSELFLDDPHAAANDMVVMHQHPVIGRQQLARHYVRFGNTQAVPGRPTPLLGEHTREILQEVGYTAQGIAELYTKGVVRTEEPAGA
jgi:crotonobetainyl-CoA:carnitine CoA-transferase CaiB-like acyl-CoA transferase